MGQFPFQARMEIVFEENDDALAADAEHIHLRWQPHNDPCVDRE
jgi:hypothetical protein